MCYGNRRVLRSHITGVTICYGHRRVYDVRSHITGGTICYWHERVNVVRSHIKRGYDVLRASACSFCEITYHRGYD